MKRASFGWGIIILCFTQIAYGIVGGEQIDASRARSVVRLSYEGQLCTGVFLGNNTVLTAAHCLNPDNRSMRSGGPQQRVSIGNARGVALTLLAQVYTHPLFDPQETINDLAVVKFDPMFNLADSYREATLSTELLQSGQEFTLYGFGLTDPDDVRSGGVLNRGRNRFNPFSANELDRFELNEDNAKTVSEAILDDQRKGRILFYESYQDGASIDFARTAEGDSGGPMMVNGKVVGICSKGFRLEQELEESTFERVLDATEDEENKNDLRSRLKDSLGVELHHVSLAHPSSQNFLKGLYVLANYGGDQMVPATCCECKGDEADQFDYSLRLGWRDRASECGSSCEMKAASVCKQKLKPHFEKLYPHRPTTHDSRRY